MVLNSSQEKHTSATCLLSQFRRFSMRRFKESSMILFNSDLKGKTDIFIIMAPPPDTKVVFFVHLIGIIGFAVKVK
ncbi:uncharacterized protein LOC111831442 [Capsella rubella]|uniref:uncharacterized protein LOC111831442 n=1 Tax=Capsella rubella TaxID=81985 RepID=UPI000CD4D135|nr:uncharacterized protein LOC111831442 [Capsella rubella]